MRTARKNKEIIWYALLSGETTEYKDCDDGETLYVEIDGSRYRAETGVHPETYSAPVRANAHITPLGSESYARGNKALDEFYGVDITKYEALIVAQKGTFPFDETTILWKEHEPEYINGVVDPDSADFRIRRVAKSLNNELFLMTRQERENGN